MKKGNSLILTKAVALFLSLIFICSAVTPAFAADGESAKAEKNYIIDNPYEDIDWDTWGSYKTQLHSHTTASDGYLTIHEYVQEHYDYDYDIVVLTDHGTINKGWNQVPDLIPLLRFVKKERTKMADIVPLTEEEYAAYQNGTAKSEQSPNYTPTRTHANGMLDVPKGIELNMATPVADCHLTGYFCDYGQGLAGVFGDYETPSKGVKEAGGISFLSHVGEYVYTDKDSADHVGQKIDDYYPSKFARIFLDNAGSSLGMGINSATDAHTRCDRILYDQVLQKTIPNGVVPWGNTFADSHNMNSVNDAFTMNWMKDFNMDAFRESLEKGQFFSITYYSNGVELNGMPEIPGFDEEKADEQKLANAPTPNVTRLTVDQDADTITVEGVNFKYITWVSNGNVLRRDTVTDGKATLNLHDDNFEAEPYLYVRFYITDEEGKNNGICYSQPLVLHVEGEDFEPVEVPKTIDLPYYLRLLVTVLDWTVFKFNPIIWIFKYFALGYNVFDNFFNAY